MARSNLPWQKSGSNSGRGPGTGRRRAAQQPSGTRSASSPRRSSALMVKHNNFVKKFQSNRSSRRRPAQRRQQSEVMVVDDDNEKGMSMSPRQRQRQRQRQSQSPDSRMTMDMDQDEAEPLDGSFASHAPVKSFTHATNTTNNYHTQASSPFLVDSTSSILSPRADIWLYLFLTSCASTSSLSVSTPASFRAWSEMTALAAMGCSTVISLVMAISFRYRPSRNGLTSSLNGNFGNFTGELLVSVLVLCLWMVSMSLVMSESSYMAVAESEIWNTNLFFATWISVSLASYLVADLITTEDASGILPKECALVLGNAISRGWALLFMSAVSLLAFSIALRSGASCSVSGGSTMNNACEMTTLGIIFGILGMVLGGAYLSISLLDQQKKDPRQGGSSVRGDPQTMASSKPPSKGNLISAILSTVSLISFSVNAAFVTAPALSPGTSEPCNVYFSSWICFALSLYLCIRHAELYLVPGSTRDIRAMVAARESELLKSTKHQRNRLHRVGSRGSRGSTSTAPQSESQFGGSEDDDEEREAGRGFAGQYEEAPVDDGRNADEVLTQMCESQSEDGPMLFLPVGGCGTEASDIDDDASYPSVSQSGYNMPNAYGGAQPPAQLYQQYNGQQQPSVQGSVSVQSSSSVRGGGALREPHKPRSVSPEGDYRSAKSSVRSARRNKARSLAEASAANSQRSRVEPPEFEDSDDLVDALEPGLSNSHPNSRDPKGHLAGSFVGEIDTKLQARISTSSGSKSTSHSYSKGRSRASSQSTSNPSCVTTEGQEQIRGYAVETVYSESPSDMDQSSSYPSASNPLDRTTRPPPRPFPTPGQQSQQQQQQQYNQARRGRDPSFRAPSFAQQPQAQQQYNMPPQHQQPPPMAMPQMLRRETLTSQAFPAPQDVESTQTSVAPTIDGHSSNGVSTAKSKSTKNSGEKSRSSSRKKKRSKSRNKDKKSGTGTSSSKVSSKSPSRKSGKQRREASMRSAPSFNTGNSKGPPTMSDVSSGYQGAGPPTVSASEGSEPVTDDEPMQMGQVGPRAPIMMPPPMPMPVAQSHSIHTDGDDNRPVHAIHGTDAMSMVSDPTMDGFGPPDEEDVDRSRGSGNRRKLPSEFKGSSMAVAGQEEGMRYSYADVSAASSQTNENKVLRQGAVDMMVMEALRQAQEARQTSHHSMGNTRQTMGNNPQAHNSSLPTSGPSSSGGGSKQATRSRDSSRGNSGSGQGKPPHGGSKQLSFQKQKAKRSSRSGSGGREGKGSSGHGPGSIHSFYSESQATSFDAGDAFAC